MNVVPFNQFNDEQHECSPETDPVGQAIAALTSAAGTLYALYLERPEYREQMIADLHHISSSALAISLVWKGVRAREEA